jgi:hypothetical protein
MLTPEEQLRLIAHVALKLQQAPGTRQPPAPQLGKEAKAWAEGRAMSMEHAAAYPLQDTE